MLNFEAGIDFERQNQLPTAGIEWRESVNIQEQKNTRKFSQNFFETDQTVIVHFVSPK